MHEYHVFTTNKLKKCHDDSHGMNISHYDIGILKRTIYIFKVQFGLVKFLSLR